MSHCLRSEVCEVGCLKSFVVDTGNNSVENPGFAEKVSTKVKNIHRRLSRAEKGSKNRQTLIDKLNKVNYKIKNQRNDFLHKLSRHYVNNYKIICVEDLDVKRMKENGHNKSMHRDIHDAFWSRFMFMLSYEAECAGRRLIEVNPMNTTQRCSACRSIVEKELSDRVHECPHCGFSCDIDCNASMHIAGMEQPVAPMESTSTSHFCDASVGYDVGSPALQGGAVHTTYEAYPVW
ncbi:transposase, IS605 OrfB family [Methanothrix thermoacetophila PT]|uniref:Transposase, IS605 OrfB family n=2 Tax=Methanothrix TaxID=2222 RepID=A0B8Z6_METTP|nr:transposase, IS605 OrfB family [Methanothrix thermoacetophila PT]